jgi:hypothetical protein
MSAWYTPLKSVVCNRMAGDLAAGPPLGEIMRRYPYAKATLPGIEGRWSANERKVWFEAAGLNRSQGDRALATLEKRALIERAHGKWSGKPNVLYTRPTQRAQAVWDTATTYLALDTVLRGDASGPLHQLWQAWPDKAPKKRGAIALWYEQLDDRKYTKENLKAYAQALLAEILKGNPAIVDIDDDDDLKELWQGIYVIDPETHLSAYSEQVA